MSRYQAYEISFAVIPYRVLIFPRQGGGGATTTSNCWFSLAGQMGETPHVPIPKHALDISVEVKQSHSI